MRLFLSPLLLVILSTLPVDGTIKKSSACLVPRPAPGREPTSWKEQKSTVPLFTKYRFLQSLVGYTPLGLLPTPLESAPALAQLLQVETFMIKRDDLAGPLFGGNKVRKLEFLLGDATTKQANHIVTWGSPGSRHTTMTALYCNHIKVPCTCMYIPTTSAEASSKHLAITKENNAHEESYRGSGERELALHQHNKKHIQETGQPLYFIPEGGSDVIGALGLVSAVGEMAKQCKEQLLPLPTTMYITSASAGSAAGLLVGLDLWEIDCTIVIVAQKPNNYPHEHEDKIEKLYACVMQYLSLLDPRIPFFQSPKNIVLFKHGFTAESDTRLQDAQAVALDFFRQHGNYALDQVFASRLWGAFLLDNLDHSVPQKHVMLWNTGEITVQHKEP
jgi:1-aminocyclopropane-1-carboxylate deaminase/D-cysteine desulfhydrase-like pyridoxal-dependent ACC family enzyme